MKVVFDLDCTLENNRGMAELNLDIIPRIGETIDLDVFLTQEQIILLQEAMWDDNSGADYARVFDVNLRKDLKGNLYYRLFLMEETYFNELKNDPEP